MRLAKYYDVTNVLHAFFFMISLSQFREALIALQWLLKWRHYSKEILLSTTGLIRHRLGQQLSPSYFRAIVWAGPFLFGRNFHEL